MAKLKILSLELVAPKSRKKEILDWLQRVGVVEISVPEETDGLIFSEFSAQSSQTERDFSTVTSAAEVLKKYAPVKKPLTALLEPRKEISSDDYARRIEGLEGIVEKAQMILDNHKKTIDLEAENVRLKAQADALIPWKKADYPIKAGFTRKVAYVPGSIRKKVTEEDILGYLAQKLPYCENIEIDVLSSDDNSTYFVFWCLKEEVEECEQALRDFGFVRAPSSGELTPSQWEEQLKKSIEQNQKEIESIKTELSGLDGFYGDLEFAADALSISADRIASMSKIPETQRVFFLKGYVAKRDSEKVKKYLEKNLDAAVEVSEPGENEDVPVLLTNNAFSAPLENITGMYSLPSKTDIDPTGVMAFFYYFFFGMMFSDAGYGLMMVLACGGVLLFKRSIERKLKNTVMMYFFCGVSTLFWGAVYGSWFGNAPAVICKEFLGIPNYKGFFTGLVDPTNELMKVMIICFIFGLVHLFTGVLLKGITDLKNGKKFDAFCDTVPTYLTILGIAPVFFSLFTTVPEVFSRICTPLLIVGLILVVLTGGRDAKSIGGKIGGGLYEVYNLVGGYLGDVLSYARLLALGLATGIIAQVMNMLGSMFGSGVLKVFIFVAVFIVGHLANFAINIIGAYVHTNRLQYVEFFGKFYEGGGRAFVPLAANTKYYKFADEFSAE